MEIGKSEIIEFVDEPERGEEDDESEDQVLSDIPAERRNLACSQTDMPIKQFYDMFQTGDLNLEPDFQRKDVWDKGKASRLVESVLMDVPIPVIYLAEESDGVMTVIDGKQRLSSLIKFLRGDFALRGLKIVEE